MSLANNFIVEHLSAVHNSIQQACQQAHRTPKDVTLIAVSKKKPTTAIAQAYQAGQRHFGENYVTEGVEKVITLNALNDIVWHFIGPIQSNKSALVAEHFSWVHSLDREKIVRRLHEQRPAGLAPLQVLIQINIDDEPSKAGIAPAQLDAFARVIQSYQNIKLRGLMCIPSADASSEQRQQSYRQMQRLFSQLRAQYPTVDTLSMGMSNDLDDAIAHGTTMVRVGTAIFGVRD